MSKLPLEFSGPRRSLHARALNPGCYFLVSMSAVFCFYSVASVNASNNPSPQERAAADLDERTAQLKKAESTRKQNPDGYIYALTTMSSVIRNNNDVNKNQKEDPEADKYFELALDCFMKDRFDKAARHRIAGHLWQTSGSTSLKEFKSIFDKLCIATNRELGDDFGSVDSDMEQALRNRTTRRDNGISEQDQLNFIQRAIAIRSAALGVRSKTLSVLLYSVGQYYEQRGDNKLAEQYFLKSGNLENDIYAKVSRAESMADFYLRQHDPVKAINAWRQGAAITAKNHLNFYIDGEFNLGKAFEQAGHPEYADEIINFMFANINDLALDKFDTFLQDVVNQYIKNTNFEKAQELAQKRIAVGIRLGSTSRLTDWKIRLSDIYLAQGKSKESDALFKQIIASLALQGIPTDALRRDRADLLKRMAR
jgi:tetratricopeptide (TPR) repeat protein